MPCCSGPWILVSAFSLAISLLSAQTPNKSDHPETPAKAIQIQALPESFDAQCAVPSGFCYSVTNSTDKAIISWHVQFIATHFATGSTQKTMGGTDTVTSLPDQISRPASNNDPFFNRGLLLPGATFYQRTDYPPGSTAQNSRLEIRVETVVFDDNTYVGNMKDAERDFRFRHQTLKDIELILKTIRERGANSQVLRESLQSLASAQGDALSKLNGAGLLYLQPLLQIDPIRQREIYERQLARIERARGIYYQYSLEQDQE